MLASLGRGHGVLPAEEVAVARHLQHLQLDPPRQERRAGAERDRRVLHPDLVQQTRVVELPDEVTAADQPDVLAAGRRGHLLVHGCDVVGGEPNVALGLGELAVGEHPARDLVTPRPRVVVQDPLVGRGTHRHRPHVRDEGVIGHRPLAVDVAGDQPAQRAVGVGNEAVKTATGVVLRRHAAQSARRRRQPCAAPAGSWANRASPDIFQQSNTLGFPSSGPEPRLTRM